MTHHLTNTFVFLLICSTLIGQRGDLNGHIVDTQGNSLPFATIHLSETSIGTHSASDGSFHLSDIPYGSYILSITMLGFSEVQTKVEINAQTLELERITMASSSLLVDPVVVTGTKTFKRKTNSPVIVNIIDSKSLDNVQACNLADGLKFQTGLRVETDCQTCNYTQLRMNGLAGGYSQILINGRPIFSPLTGLYGLEQIPSNMIERIEVVRGGGSSLYGSSAIGGTVNVITRTPSSSGGEIGLTTHRINNDANDQIVDGNATVVSQDGQLAAAFFLNYRDRQGYDHNADNFTELPELRNFSLGTTIHYQPDEDQKLELSLSRLQEYRFGGQNTESEAHLAGQAEERHHDVYVGTLDYQYNIDNNRSLIAYASGQLTERDHYTGIFPDDSTEIEYHLNLPPYGKSENYTYQGGIQWNQRMDLENLGSNVLTLGSEIVYDKIMDEIEAYNYLIDQSTKNLGLFAQADWQPIHELNLLLGLRVDDHNFVDGLILSPRASLLYKPAPATQLRVSYGTGFRAPQAFDADLHIAFAGGGVSRVTLDDQLTEERSTSFSASINHDWIREHWIAGFTVEGFYTELKDAFFMDPTGADRFGLTFVKRNGPGSTVRGLTFEMRANYDKKVQIESGFTFQSSTYREAIVVIQDAAPVSRFLRTPDIYGYSTLSLNVVENMTATFNYVYTGPMLLAHFGGAPEQAEDVLIETGHFHDLGAKLTYRIQGLSRGTQFSILAGVKNMLNSYQSDFDSGKNRDSNYVYGPAQPRTFFAGIRLRFSRQNPSIGQKSR